MNTISSIEGSVERQAAGRKPARWVGGTFAGWTVGFVLALVCIIGVESLGVRETQFPLALGMAAAVGYEQARMLAPLLKSRWGWFWATLAGLTVPFMAVDVLRILNPSFPYSLAVLVAVSGLSVSVLQWRLLRRVSSGAVTWLVASPIGWVLAGSTVWVADQLPRIPGVIGALMFIATVLAGGILLGACTAAALVRIGQSPNN